MILHTYLYVFQAGSQHYVGYGQLDGGPEEGSGTLLALGGAGGGGGRGGGGVGADHVQPLPEGLQRRPGGWLDKEAGGS